MALEKSSTHVPAMEPKILGPFDIEANDIKK